MYSILIAGHRERPDAVPPTAHQAPPADEPAHRRAAPYAWALLLARIDEVFPLRCPRCGADMRIIAFITEATVLREILRALAAPAPDFVFDQRIAW